MTTQITYDPVPDPPPPGPMGGAGDMQWQCQVPPQFWGGFSGMPFHCQKQMLQDLSRGLDEIYGFSNPHNPNIPSRVTTIIGLDSPVERPPIPGADTGGGNSGMNLALSSMLTPTSKSDDDDPESPKNRKKRRFEVEIRGSDEPRSLEIPDFKDASFEEKGSVSIKHPDRRRHPQISFLDWHDETRNFIRDNPLCSD
ncbi:MAG: hypothetical protein ACT4O9_16390 [Blastocatellia bacterium]